MNYMFKGVYPEALAAFQKRTDLTDRDLTDRDPESLSMLVQVQAMSGDMTTALRTLQEMKDKVGNTSGHAWYFTIAYKALATRRKQFRDDLFRWLDKSL